MNSDKLIIWLTVFSPVLTVIVSLLVIYPVLKKLSLTGLPLLNRKVKTQTAYFLTIISLLSVSFGVLMSFKTISVITEDFYKGMIIENIIVFVIVLMLNWYYISSILLITATNNNELLEKVIIKGFYKIINKTDVETFISKHKEVSLDLFDNSVNQNSPRKTREEVLKEVDSNSNKLNNKFKRK